MIFGSLTVIKEAGSNKEGRSLWLCRCNCGETRIALGKDLGKKTTRCPKKCILTDDLSGKRIGNLIVLQQEGSDKHGFRRFRCKCVTPLKDLQSDMPEKPTVGIEAYCGNEILINAVGLKQNFKNPNKRKIPKSCFKCSRILWGNLKKKSNPNKDLIGQTFGRLTVIRSFVKMSSRELYKRHMYECVCSCGTLNNPIVRRDALLSKKEPTRSCGCLQREATKNQKPTLTHGLSDHPLYTLWHNIKRRTQDPKHFAFHSYGAKGITLCKEWEEFINFYNWAIGKGWQKDMTIDRINPKKSYFPTNCQVLSRLDNILKMHKDNGKASFTEGVQINVKELGRTAKVPYLTTQKLIRAGYSSAEIFEYAKLKLHQRQAIGRAITRREKLPVSEALKIQKQPNKKKKQSSEMGSYRAMMARCYYSKDSSYHNYGAKGIKVCSEWKGRPTQFLKDMGPKPEPKQQYAIDRIDPTQDYRPNNCRWILSTENSRRATKIRNVTEESE